MASELQLVIAFDGNPAELNHSLLASGKVFLEPSTFFIDKE